MNELSPTLCLHVAYRFYSHVDRDQTEFDIDTLNDDESLKQVIDDVWWESPF